jgi:hypothetical protein
MHTTHTLENNIFYATMAFVVQIEYIVVRVCTALGKIHMHR